MLKVQIIHSPVFAENPTNPARAYLGSNIIEINDAAFYALPAEHQKVILRHEYGHLLSSTRSEIEADSYAIEQSDRKDSESLVKTMEALEAVGGHDENRMQAALTKSLLVAAKRGNKKAAGFLGIPVNAAGEAQGNDVKTVITIVLAVIIAAGTLYFISKWIKRK